MSEQMQIQSVRSRLLREMKEGAYRYSGKLPPEGVLAERLSISRTQLRDSLAQLEREGFISRHQGVGTVIMFMNPEVIVMGTIAIHAGDLLLEPLRAALPRFAWKHSLDACRIVPSALGDRIGDLSALALAVSHGDSIRSADK